MEHFGYLLIVAFLLLCLSRAETCQFQNVTYNNQATFPHQNECAKIQCQFGQPVIYYQACGREVDGNCHPLNQMFEYRNQTFQCRNVAGEGGVQLRHEVVVVIVPWCFNRYYMVPGEMTRLKINHCSRYQCQNGELVLFSKICYRKSDEECHYEGEYTVEGNTTYQCITKDVNGSISLQYKKLYAGSAGKPCLFDNKTINHLDVRNHIGQQNRYQCRDGTAVLFLEYCTIPEILGAAFEVGRWTSSGGTTLKCNRNPETGQLSLDPTTDLYRRCQLPSGVRLKHLEVLISADGCRSDQCQNGDLVNIQDGCYSGVIHRCYQLNQIWSQGNSTLKCIKGDSRKYTIMDVPSGAL